MTRERRMDMHRSWISLIPIRRSQREYNTNGVVWLRLLKGPHFLLSSTVRKTTRAQPTFPPWRLLLPLLIANEYSFPSSVKWPFAIRLAYLWGNNKVGRSTFQSSLHSNNRRWQDSHPHSGNSTWFPKSTYQGEAHLCISVLILHDHRPQNSTVVKHRNLQVIISTMEYWQIKYPKAILWTSSPLGREPKSSTYG